MGVMLETKIGKLKLKNPVMAASGTFGCGEEYGELFDIDKLGAIITKTITLSPTVGNPPPRVAETASGMLNSIGLENDGVGAFLKKKEPFLKKLRTAVVVSIAADDADGFAALAKRVSRENLFGAIELNLSCPNLKGKGIIAQDEKALEAIVRAARESTRLTLIAKLSPNVADIAAMARVAEKSGADAVSLINTFPAMAVDIKTRRPLLGNATGGLSGPAIKPIALKMVWDVYNAVKIPVIGIGGIMTAKDAVEFILCGASAVQVGTALFVNPKAPLGIIEGMEDYLKSNGLKEIKSLIGVLQR
jgi:dihydroorotate dehydrogenase (NAD+) catalytic subunit